MKKFLAAAAAASLTTALVACSNSGSSEPVTVTETQAPVTVTEAEAQTESNGSATSEQNNTQAQQGVDRPENVPTISSYSTKAEMEMQEDGLNKQDVEGVVQAAIDGTADKIEWDNDGYFELEHQGIDVDITPEGEVLDASR